MHADSRVPPREIFDADTSPSLSSNRKAGLCRNIGTMWVMRWRRLRDGDDSTERGFAGADEQSNLPWPVASTHGGLVCSSLLITLVHCCFSYYIKQLLMVITMSKHYFSSFVKKPSHACCWPAVYFCWARLQHHPAITPELEHVAVNGRRMNKHNWFQNCSGAVICGVTRKWKWPVGAAGLDECVCGSIMNECISSITSRLSVDFV